MYLPYEMANYEDSKFFPRPHHSGYNATKASVTSSHTW